MSENLLVKLIKYEEQYWAQELVGIMTEEEALEYEKNHQERWVSYGIRYLSDRQEYILSKIGKEKMEEKIREYMPTFYTPAKYR
jgi:hypothetical protein